ncbi:hypothetical protein MKW98_022954 [Papaver atlanticum]|uniref:Uncharacterized protein n=1 Tax=Papaver atlanticum TaxID=357466 RepID=A0AAD4TA87_9MAGN|nr:hypothetical protein MKW98_022954 [Papaver atlanticum]
MSSILNLLVRVSTSTNARSTTTKSARYSQFIQVKLYHDENHYQHGVPGIPTNGKLVLLRNSNNGSQLYLLGTNPAYRESARTVKKVINSVRPDVVAAMSQAEDNRQADIFRDWIPANKSWYSLFLRSMRTPGGLINKIIMFLKNVEELRQQEEEDDIGPDFKVAMEESLKVEAKLVSIGHDLDDIVKQVDGFHIPLKIIYQRCKAINTFDKLKFLFVIFFTETGSRPYIREDNRCSRALISESHKVKVEDEDIVMFTSLRRMEERLIVAVVGIAHMDGIEQLWKREEANDNQQTLTKESACQQTRDRDVKMVKM